MQPKLDHRLQCDKYIVGNVETLQSPVCFRRRSTNSSSFKQMQIPFVERAVQCNKSKKECSRRSTLVDVNLFPMTSRMRSYEYVDATFSSNESSLNKLPVLQRSVVNEEHLNSSKTFPNVPFEFGDSFSDVSNDWWNQVTDESFLKTERQCQSLCDSESHSVTMLSSDIEEPSDFYATASFVIQFFSINEESKSINSTNEEFIEDENYLSSKEEIQSYGPSLINVFPKRKRINFYDFMDS